MQSSISHKVPWFWVWGVSELFWLQQLCFLAVAREMDELQCFNISVYKQHHLLHHGYLRAVPQPHKELEQAPLAHFALLSLLLLLHGYPCWCRCCCKPMKGKENRRELFPLLFLFCLASHIQGYWVQPLCILNKEPGVGISVFSPSALHPGWPLVIHCLCFPPVKTQPKALHTSKAFPWEESVHCYSKNNHKVLKTEERLLPGKAAQMES